MIKSVKETKITHDMLREKINNIIVNEKLYKENNEFRSLVNQVESIILYNDFLTVYNTLDLLKNTFMNSYKSSKQSIDNLGTQLINILLKEPERIIESQSYFNSGVYVYCTYYSDDYDVDMIKFETDDKEIQLIYTDKWSGKGLRREKEFINEILKKFQKVLYNSTGYNFNIKLL